VTDFRIWFGTCLDMAGFCNVADLRTWFGDLDTETKQVAEPRGVCFLSLSLSFLRSFPSAVVAGLLLLYCCAMDDRNAMHMRLSTTLRHVKKSVTAMDVKLWQQWPLGKWEEVAAQETPEDLKLPMSPSREFVSKALVSSTKQASTANFWISLDLSVFFCMWFLFCIFFASTCVDISYLFFNLPRLRV
jgi:hypothetical protein